MSLFLPYENLKARIDEKFNQISSKYPQDFHCQSGCHQCCHPKLTISLVEALALIELLTQNEGLAQAVVENEKSNPFADQRCSFLNPQGQCMIYEARPVVCRTHGAPLLIEIEEERANKPQGSTKKKTTRSKNELEIKEVVQSSCELNFVNGLKIQPGEWFNQHTVATMLGLFNQYFEETLSPRIDLKPSALLAQKDLLIKYQAEILRAREEIENARRISQEQAEAKGQD